MLRNGLKRYGAPSLLDWTLWAINRALLIIFALLFLLFSFRLYNNYTFSETTYALSFVVMNRVEEIKEILTYD